MRVFTPQPGRTADACKALVESGVFVFADLYTITPAEGSVMYYTDAQQDISIIPAGGTMYVTFVARTVLVQGLKSHLKIGVEVDEQQIQIDYSRADDYQGRAPWMKALLFGWLDGATIQRDRVVADEWAPDIAAPWWGTAPMFKGFVADLQTVGRQTTTMSVKSALMIFDTQMPRSLYLARCKNTWGDTACGVDQATYLIDAPVGAGTPTSTFLPWTGAGATSFVDGKLYIVAPDGFTRVRKILKTTGAGIFLIYPLDFVPAVGDGFTIYPGCSGTMVRCQVYWGSAWLDHFTGFPFTPVSESAV